METIYLDNAATTPMDPQVVDVMSEFMKAHFGNPSSTHAYGRKVKDAIETARRSIAQHLNCSPGEICFTSGGTEADNQAIITAVDKLGVKVIITTAIEHAAVLNTVNLLESAGRVKVHHLELDARGVIDMTQLEDLLHRNEDCLVSLMHANNEIANRIDLAEVGRLCKSHGALFHSDTVQTMAHYRFDLQECPIDFLTGSAHKFHGPKGVGFLFHRKELGTLSLIQGGGQERGRRAGTENVYGIIGMAEAMDLAYAGLEEHQKHIQALKTSMIEELKAQIPGVAFNGQSEEVDSLYTVLNVNFPDTDIASMMLFRLDIEGVACSGGSACSSGSSSGSHVIAQLSCEHAGPNIRFSFSRMNTAEDIKNCVSKLSQLMTAEV